MSNSFEIRCRRLIDDLHLASADDVLSVRSLTGGVASDIGVADLGDRQICVKFALEKLKVEEDWFAPLHRNRAEYDWLTFATSVDPQCVPLLYGRSERENGFAMAFLPPDQVDNWKDVLLRAVPPQGEAASVGRVLGQIHAASSSPSFDRSLFENRDDFHALRIEPYLLFTATRHDAVAKQLGRLADSLHTTDPVLIHGDVSPKNILFRSGHPIILDAECATMGDPAFDVAFCLNHLVLKAAHVPAIRAALLAAIEQFWTAYKPHVRWEHEDLLEDRVCRLLPALMLARIDGKSPVEYLDDGARMHLRSLSLSLINAPTANLQQFIDHFRSNLRSE
ncbi:MAG: aminoglycoside phosphotransferase family protein [Alphaproteobacteria bacterium]|nr:aminoglycoside phosphotransferase family protein [Alphaproteobacteria bacterium]